MASCYGGGGGGGGEVCLGLEGEGRLALPRTWTGKEIRWKQERRGLEGSQCHQYTHS